MPGITIANLVQNGTMNAQMAAVLWSAVDEQISFLTAAVPRLAGKTTTSNAVLSLRAPGVPAHLVAGEPEVMDQLKRERRGGYLVVAEFAPVPVPGYIWGAPVRRVFEAVHEGGYALQTALHAPSAVDAMLEVTRGNQVNDEHASVFKLILYIERFGNSHAGFWRRVTDLYEVFEVTDGRPRGQSLFQWDPDNDSFSQIAEPRQFGSPKDVADRTKVIDGLVEGDHTSPEAVSAAVSDYHAKRGRRTA